MGCFHASLGILHHVLKWLKAVTPMDLSTGVLFTALLDFANHPLQRNVAHLKPVVVQISASLVGLPRLDGILEAAPERQLDHRRLRLSRPVFFNQALLRRAQERLFFLGISLFCDHDRPATADIAVVTREPDLFDVFFSGWLVVVNSSSDVLCKKSRLELDTTLVDSHSVTNVNSNRGNAVPDAKEEYLDILLFAITTDFTSMGVRCISIVLVAMRALGCLTVLDLALQMALIETKCKRDQLFVAFTEKADLVEHSGEELGSKGTSTEAKDVDFRALEVVSILDNTLRTPQLTGS
ncbi:hypothetical protein HG531_007529 [Fusarium graminearum]|nr:hypothetical protein HG531_007529 [Fusarium graminearum]